MYKEDILDLYKRPRNEGKIDGADFEAKAENPSCGDETVIYLEFDDGKLTDIKHETDACAICTASTSILTDEVKGLSKKELDSLDKDWMLDKLGIEVSPMRMKCAVLGLKTVKSAIE